MRRIVSLSLFLSFLTVAGAARADSDDRGSAVRLLTSIPVPGHLVVFDISWLDPDTQLYYLADRSNNAIDVVDAKRNEIGRAHV